MQHERGPLGRGEALEDDGQRHAHAVVQGHVLGRIGRQPRMIGRQVEPGLVAGASRGHVVQTDAPGDHDQPAAHVIDVVEVDIHQAHERLLHDVLRLADAADHAEGEVDEVTAVVGPHIGQSIVACALHT